MSETATPDVPSAVRQQELAQELGSHLVPSAPDEWSTLSYETFGVVGLQEATLQVTYADGHTQWFRPPPAAAPLAHELRQVMYREGKGTWFSARFMVTRPQSLDVAFNYDDEPPWDAPIDPAHYARELEKFPRNDDATPGWLRDRTTGIGAP
jgi:hypothetical protein